MSGARIRFPYSGRRPRGFSLVEATVSILLVGGLLVLSLNLVGASAAGQKNMGDGGRARLLALGLMSEILTQAYVEPVDTPVFGPETGESGGSRQAFDDVDDYHNWSASPPQIQDGTVMSDLTGWERAVTVEYVEPADLTTTSVTDTGVKRITVSVNYDSSEVCTMVSVRTDGI
jgi:type II secretory pathway pseudopilin PulG